MQVICKYFLSVAALAELRMRLSDIRICNAVLNHCCWSYGQLFTSTLNKCASSLIVGAVLDKKVTMHCSHLTDRILFYAGLGRVKVFSCFIPEIFVIKRWPKSRTLLITHECCTYPDDINSGHVSRQSLEACCMSRS